jgi:cell division protein FtsQ
MSRPYLEIAAPRPGARFEGAFRKALWVVIIVLALSASCLLVFQLFISPNLLVRTIEIKSDLSLSREEILALAQLGGRDYFFGIDAGALEARLKANPLVREAVVEKVFPDTLRLSLAGRRPLLLAHARTGGRPLPVVFDEDGVLFERGAGLTERNLPVLSGITFEETAAGTLLPRTWHSFLKDLGDLKRNDPRLFNLISEIRVVTTKSGNYELVLYPLSWPVRIWIGRRLSADMLRYMLHTLYFMETEGILREVDEIDFRSGEAVYRRKGVEDLGAR